MKRKITSRDVAKEANVSQSLVSLILNNVPGKKIKLETREHVLEVASKLGYKINVNARSMKSSKASAIGLLSLYATDSFVFPPVINGIKSVCFENDLGVIICSNKKNSYDSYDFIDYYLQNRIDGLILIAYVGIGNDGIINELIKADIPFVCIIGARDIEGVSCVDVNFIESGYIAVKHLIDNGYKDIAYILEDKVELLNYAEKERLEGCNKAAKENNVQIHLIEDFIGISGEENNIKIANNILEFKRVDSVISTSYKSFIFLKAAAKKNINIPQSFGVISLDNELYAPYLFPALTTIDEPLFEIANTATRILLEKIQGEGICKKEEVHPNISIRESTNRLSKV